MGHPICNFSVALYKKNNQVKLTKLLMSLMCIIGAINICNFNQLWNFHNCRNSFICIWYNSISNTYICIIISDWSCTV